MPYIALFLEKDIVQISERWRFRLQTPALLLKRIVSVTKLWLVSLFG